MPKYISTFDRKALVSMPMNILEKMSVLIGELTEYIKKIGGTMVCHVNDTEVNYTFDLKDSPYEQDFLKFFKDTQAKFPAIGLILPDLKPEESL